MAVVAVLDARTLPEQGLNQKIAGLSLVERAIRMVRVNGADDVILWTANGLSASVNQQARTVKGQPVTVVCDFAAVRAAVGVTPRVLVLDVGTVFHRGMVKDLMAHPAEVSRARLADGALVRAAMMPRQRLTNFSDLESFLENLDGPVIDENRWQVRVQSTDDARTAERALWLDCRKPLDGMVSRHINRYGSLFVSRLLAPTPITPNHISIFTFSLGILAGVLAAMGGPLNFLLAGLVFQINSVIDGCDGELARVRYEFSVLGEWLDTLSDDFSDIFFWGGLGIGAAKLAEGPWGLQPDVWLWLGIAAVIGKVLSMIVYYQWLIANKRGDLLAFTWSFDEADENASLVARTLKILKYFAKKDFIVFAAMLLGFLGWLPWILVPMAIGNLVVAFSVLAQKRKNA